MKTKRSLNVDFGANYYHHSTPKIIHANQHDLYYYTTYIGHHVIALEQGDSLFYIDQDQLTVHVTRGPTQITSLYFATVIRGYMSDQKSCELTKATHLPYINGCSSKQLFPPTRPGDPTWQMLHLPQYTSEQAHHIHSTVRVVFVLAGKGHSIVGMQNQHHTQELKPGMIAIYERMCPHHFVTDDSELIVLPLHIYSSIGATEHNHPMYNGTHRVGDHDRHVV